MTPPSYTQVRLRTDDAEPLRRLTRRVAAEADRDLSQSDVLGLLIQLGSERLAELAAIANPAEGSER